MRRLILAGLAGALLCSSAWSQVSRQVEILPGSGDPVPISREETVRYIEAALPKARDLLDRELIDYPSARFRDVQASGAPLGLSATFCGLINAPNRTGGFTGWEPFMLTISDGSEALRLGADGNAGQMIRVLCTAPRRVTVEGDYSDKLTYR